MEVSSKIKFMSLMSKIIGNPNMLAEDCDFGVTDSTPETITGTFAIRGNLAKELRGLFATDIEQRRNP